MPVYVVNSKIYTRSNRFTVCKTLNPLDKKWWDFHNTTRHITWSFVPGDGNGKNATIIYSSKHITHTRALNRTIANIVVWMYMCTISAETDKMKSLCKIDNCFSNQWIEWFEEFTEHQANKIFVSWHMVYVCMCRIIHIIHRQINPYINTWMGDKSRK